MNEQDEPIIWEVLRTVKLDCGCIVQGLAYLSPDFALAQVGTGDPVEPEFYGTVLTECTGHTHRWLSGDKDTCMMLVRMLVVYAEQARIAGDLFQPLLERTLKRYSL